MALLGKFLVMRQEILNHRTLHRMTDAEYVVSGGG